MRRLALFAITIRYLKPRQLLFRLWRKLYRPQISEVSSSCLRTLGELRGMPIKATSICDVSITQSSAAQIDTIRFLFLNHSIQFVNHVKWDDSEAERLWLYNLHYFDFLNSRECLDNPGLSTFLLEDWMDRNAIGSTPGWEPYPTSLRIVNWIKWHICCQSLSQATLDNLATQARWLSGHLEYHILANHLFANTKAMLIAGLFFEGAEADRWLESGKRLIEEQLVEQILSDGGHYERSPMYHNIVLEDVLDMINLAQASSGRIGSELSNRLEASAAHMLEWMVSMSHPDGEISFFNDAAFDIAARPQELLRYARRLNIPVPAKSDNSRQKAVHLQSSGYVRMESGDLCVLVDVAPVGPDYQPGHAHADTLSFELSWRGQRVFVNSGTSTYVAGHLRSTQRSSALHNTLEIDRKNSSTVWGGFRVAGRAEPFNVTVKLDDLTQQVTASHDGYCTVTNHCVPTREYLLTDETLIIKDTVRGRYNLAISRYYLHPDIVALKGQRLELPGGQQIVWSLLGGHAEMIESLWYPRFGCKVASNCIVATKNSDCSIPMTFSIEPCS